MSRSVIARWNLTRTLVVARLCMGALLAAGCTSASLPQPSASLTQLASSAPTTSSSEIKHVSAGPVGLDAPRRGTFDRGCRTRAAT